MIPATETSPLSTATEQDSSPVPMHLPSPSASPSEETFPSLVTQLQQMHGLTKKKVYGSKPKRRPFVSSEVYRDNPQRRASSLSPVSSSLPPVSPSDTNHGGRVTSPSAQDRAARVYSSGSTFPQPSSAGRSSVDLGLSSSTPERRPAASYVPPSAIPSTPPSPILSHAPPLWDPSVSSRTNISYQQEPVSSLHLYTGSRSQTELLAMPKTVGQPPASRGNGNIGLPISPVSIHAPNPTHARDDPRGIGVSLLRNHNYDQDPSIDMMNTTTQTINTIVSSSSTSKPIPNPYPHRNFYRAELLSHIETGRQSSGIAMNGTISDPGFPDHNFIPTQEIQTQMQSSSSNAQNVTFQSNLHRAPAQNPYPYHPLSSQPHPPLNSSQEQLALPLSWHSYGTSPSALDSYDSPPHQTSTTSQYPYGMETTGHSAASVSPFSYTSSSLPSSSQPSSSHPPSPTSSSSSSLTGWDGRGRQH
jgi:hypothetical protein